MNFYKKNRRNHNIVVIRAFANAALLGLESLRQIAKQTNSCVFNTSDVIHEWYKGEKQKKGRERVACEKAFAFIANYKTTTNAHFI